METESLIPDAEESAMRELGRETDAEQGRETVETPSETPVERATEADVEAQTEEPPQPPLEVEGEPLEQPERQRDPVTGKFQRSDRPETEYSKAQKEQERRDRSWQALQAEKEQFRMYANQWEEQQRMAQLEATRQQYQPLKREGLTAQQYYKGAIDFEQQGDHENALKAYRVAADLGREEQARVSQMQEVEAEYQWRVQMQQVGQVAPQIWDPNHPMVAHLERIIGQNPWIYRVPQGFIRAAEVADMLCRMDAIKELQDELERKSAELEKYQRKGQPAKGGYASPRTGEKEFDEMGLDEMEAHLKSLTAQADNYR